MVRSISHKLEGQIFVELQSLDIVDFMAEGWHRQICLVFVWKEWRLRICGYR